MEYRKISRPTCGFKVLL
ncbi:unnamed protein product [Acanthoscelides obtectus]|uniref:Uncharacterized protein n=1 Tax=Acanthoscelides obtectus TaxID=200917 RepID=A0A9P0LX85_ACAOB|nr:unnamed protein product [Acanthoscelides obtectus]CAH2005001.1 unnamed protein product [Acanthoscelides obtectus]CAH2011505.1 unnamed protein product [Acanthoscelides obtectus]CAK1668408.1 hypothetical protein AOBTE_LOCUS26378 [Acanthoscelides obtectus]CAK1668409.1 hypothetical protein AOBTE_LOCUS26379 [Acanthoscelides obtectus]